MWGDNITVIQHHPCCMLLGLEMQLHKQMHENACNFSLLIYWLGNGASNSKFPPEQIDIPKSPTVH